MPHLEIGLRSILPHHEAPARTAYGQLLSIIIQGSYQYFNAPDSRKQIIDSYLATTIAQHYKENRRHWIVRATVGGARRVPTAVELDDINGDDIDDMEPTIPAGIQHNYNGAEPRGLIDRIQNFIPDVIENPQRHAIDRAKKEVQKGKFGLAVRILTNDTPPNRTAAELAAILRPLHHATAQEELPPAAPEETLDIDLETLPTADQKFSPVFYALNPKKMKGPDIYGLTREAQACLIETNEDLYQKFANIAVNGRIPPITLQLLNNDRRIALPKPNSDSHRPVSLRPHLFLPVERHLARGLNDKTREVSAPQQMGVGHQAGCEDVYHTVLNATRNQDTAVVRIDCSNAYGNISRNSIYRAIRQHHPALLPYISALFRHSGSGVAQGTDGKAAIITNRDGVPQGSPLSSGLFCLALDIAIKQTAHDNNSTLITAIADDIFIIGEVPDLEPAIADIIDNLNNLCLPVNPSKTTFFSRSADTRAQLQQLLDDGILHGRLERDGIIIAGVPISTNHAFTVQFLRQRVASTASLLASIIHLPPELAYPIYRSCIQTKWNHIWRSGAAEGIDNKRIIDDLTKLQNIFAEYISDMHTGTWAYPEHQAIRQAAIEASTTCGGIGIALAPNRRIRLAMAVGTYMDVITRLAPRAKTHDFPFLTFPQCTPQWEKEPLPPQYGLHSDHPHIVIDKWYQELLFDFGTIIYDEKESDIDTTTNLWAHLPLDHNRYPRVLQQIHDVTSYEEDKADSRWAAYVQHFKARPGSCRVPQQPPADATSIRTGMMRKPPAWLRERKTLTKFLSRITDQGFSTLNSAKDLDYLQKVFTEAAHAVTMELFLVKPNEGMLTNLPYDTSTQDINILRLIQDYRVLIRNTRGSQTAAPITESHWRFGGGCTTR